MWTAYLLIAMVASSLFSTPEASRVDPFGCQNITNASVCTAKSSCAWTGDACITICNWQQSLSGVCTSSQCMWNPEYTVCGPACLVLGNNFDLCVTTPQCAWNDVTRLCAFDCGAVGNRTSCAALPACTWSAEFGVCRTSCYFRYTVARLCDADPECMWNPAAGDCQPGCPAYNGNAVQCFGATTCTYNSNLLQCSLACDSVQSQWTCQNDYGCLWDSANGTCILACVFGYRTQSSCDGSGRCRWDTTLNACATRCDTITSVASCTADARCFWDGARCSETCVSATSDGACSQLGSACEWVAPTQQCQPICGARNTSSCVTPVDSLCEIDGGGVCTPECSALYLAPRSCNADTRCNWNDTISFCEASCFARSDAKSCSALSSCSWAPTKSLCMATCTIEPNATACNARLECLWSTTLQYCRTGCDMLTDPSMCNTDTQCSWDYVGEQCHASCAGRYSTKAACVVDARCVWNAPHTVCQQNCSFIGAASTCNETSTCAWNSATSVCISTVASVEIASQQYAEQLNNTELRPNLVIALQEDLSTAYNAQVQLIDARIVVAAATATVPFVAPIGPTPTAIAQSVGTGDNGWLKNTVKAFAANGGTQSLIVSEYVPPGPAAPATSAPSSPTMTLQMIILVVGCSVAALLTVSACTVWGWRHNPYAAATRPVQTTERFTTEEYDRLKSMNERVVTYEEALDLKQRWDATHGAAGANEAMNRWPVVAKADMPKNQQRKPAQRQVWDAMCTTLFPSVFEHLTQQRISIDENGYIRTSARNAIEVMRFTLALRLHAQGKGNIEFVMSGLARLALMDDAGRLLSVSTNIIDPTVDVFPSAREAFERSGWCTHVGSYETRKIVFGRLRPCDSFVVVATDPLPEATPILVGFPASWQSTVIETAVRLMLRLGTATLESRRDFSSERLRVHRLGDTWRLNASNDVLAAIAVIGPRFWAVDNDVLCCHCSVGIPISATVPFVNAIRTAMDVSVPIPSRNRSPSTHPDTTTTPSAMDVSAGSSISDLELALVSRHHE